MKTLSTCLLFAAAAFAQQGEDARALLGQISSAAQTVKSWRVEGLMSVETRRLAGPPMGTLEQTPFRASVQAPHRARLDGPYGAIEVLCDGSALWRVSGGVYSSSPAEDAAACLSAGSSSLIWPYPAWSRLREGLESAVIAGAQTVEFQGAETTCEVVKAEYSRLPVTIAIPQSFAISPSEPCTRVLCIDRRRRLILRDQVTAKLRPDPQDAPSIEVTVTAEFHNVVREPQLPADHFVFRAPPGARALGEPAASSADDRNRPAVALSKRAPEYTEDAREGRIEGTVTLSLEVDAAGVPRKIRVTRSLYPSLDRKAVEAVGEWHFLPALKDGKPVAFPTTVELEFRLAQEEPGDPVIHLPDPRSDPSAAPLPAPAPAAPKPDPREPAPGVLLDGYVTALFVTGREARTQRFNIGDSVKDIRGFLANGARFTSDASGRPLVTEVDPGWREIYCGVVRYAVNAPIAPGQPYPPPQKLVILADQDDRMRAVVVE